MLDKSKPFTKHLGRTDGVRFSQNGKDFSAAGREIIKVKSKAVKK